MRRGIFCAVEVILLTQWVGRNVTAWTRTSGTKPTCKNDVRAYKICPTKAHLAHRTFFLLAFCRPCAHIAFAILSARKIKTTPFCGFLLLAVTMCPCRRWFKPSPVASNTSPLPENKYQCIRVKALYWHTAYRFAQGVLRQVNAIRYNRSWARVFAGL